MAIAIIRPTGAGSSTELVPSAGNNWACVDEASKDESDYVQYETTGTKDLYAMANPATLDADDIINSVTLYAYAAPFESSSASKIKFHYKVGATTITGDAIALNGTKNVYVLVSQTWTDHNGSAWTLSDIQNMEAGFYLYDRTYTRCCQFWVEIDYTHVSKCNRAQIIGLC